MTALVFVRRFAFALCLVVLGFASGAKAETHSISALGFQVLDCNDPGHNIKGLRSVACGTLVAPVQFVRGIRICKFALKYLDNDADEDVTATLERKRITSGTLPNKSPNVMATVKSSGKNSKLQSKQTTAIKTPVVDLDNFVYYTKIKVPPNADILLAAAVIDTSAFATCP